MKNINGMAYSSNVRDYYQTANFFVGINNIESIHAYKDLKRETGGFLRAILEGDLFRAVTQADVNNQQRIYHITRYITDILPEESFGTPEKVAKWLQKK